MFYQSRPCLVRVQIAETTSLYYWSAVIFFSQKEQLALSVTCAPKPNSTYNYFFYILVIRTILPRLLLNNLGEFLSFEAELLIQPLKDVI